MGKNRQIDPEGGAFARLALTIYPAAMFLNNPVTDAQAKTCSICFFVCIYLRGTGSFQFQLDITGAALGCLKGAEGFREATPMTSI
ncbi:MAG: hypothetical protein BA865_14625 [Desulfobacterales bacterium S5133MH4]|nr:MAG: hypothetical protein BA865_14625 [Desulfobacterales bacterium S5133MH4]